MPVKKGDRVQIPNDGMGRPVLEFDKQTRSYTEQLQWFEVVSVASSKIELKPVWPDASSG